MNLKLIRDVLEYAGFTVWSPRPARKASRGHRAAAPTSCSWTSSCQASTGPRRCAGSGPIRAPASVPVVAVTAFAMRADREHVSAGGFDGYLEKPISMRALARAGSSISVWSR